MLYMMLYMAIFECKLGYPPVTCPSPASIIPRMLWAWTCSTCLKSMKNKIAPSFSVRVLGEEGQNVRIKKRKYLLFVL